MIVIKNIEVFETDLDLCEIVSYAPPGQLVFPSAGEEPVTIDALRELVRGRRFVRPSDGTDIIIGVSKQAADIIGIQYEAWGQLQERLGFLWFSLSKCNKECVRLETTIRSLEAAGFFKRLLWLFGVKRPTIF